MKFKVINAFIPAPVRLITKKKYFDKEYQMFTHRIIDRYALSVETNYSGNPKLYVNLTHFANGDKIAKAAMIHDELFFIDLLNNAFYTDQGQDKLPNYIIEDEIARREEAIMCNGVVPIINPFDKYKMFNVQTYNQNLDDYYSFDYNGDGLNIYRHYYPVKKNNAIANKVKVATILDPNLIANLDTMFYNVGKNDMIESSIME